MALVMSIYWILLNIDHHRFVWILQLMNLFYRLIWNLGMHHHYIIIQHFWKVLILRIIFSIHRLNCLEALFRAKIDIERLYNNRLLYSSTHSHQNSVPNRTTRLLFVLLGIILVALVFGLTVLFFQSMYV
jgi:hypothetical protein